MGFLWGFQKHCEVFTREDWRHEIKEVFISQLATTLGVLDPRVALNLSQSEFLSTKAIFWIDIFWLTRTANNTLCKDSYLLWSAEWLSFMDPVSRKIIAGLSAGTRTDQRDTDPHQYAQEVSYLSKVTHS